MVKALFFFMIVWMIPTHVFAQINCEKVAATLEEQQNDGGDLKVKIQQCQDFFVQFKDRATPDCRRRIYGILAVYAAINGAFDLSRQSCYNEMYWAGKCTSDTALILANINCARILNVTRPDSTGFYLDKTYQLLRATHRKPGSVFVSILDSIHLTGLLDTMRLQPFLVDKIPNAYKRLWRQYLEMKGNSLIYSTQTTTAESCLKLAIFLDKQNPMDDNLSTTWSNLGLLHQNQGRHTTAVEYFLQAIDKNSVDSIEYTSTNTLVNVMYSFRIMKRYDLAKTYGERALALTEKYGMNKDRCRVLSQISSVYLAENKFPEAQQFLWQSIALSNLLQNEPDLCYSYRKLADVKVNHLNQFDSGKIFIDSSAYYARKIGDDGFFYYINSTLSAYYLKMGRLDSALHYAQKSYEESVLYKDREIQLSSLYLLYEINQGMNKPSQALSFYKSWSQLRDSISGAEMQFMVSDIQEKYESQKKQLAITQFEQESERKALQTKIMVGGLLILAALSGLLYFFIVNLRRQRTKLQETNSLLEDVTSVQNKMFGIISHDLKGMLVPFSKAGKIMGHYVAQNDNNSLKNFADKLEETADRLSLTLNNLLHWALQQMRGIQLKKEVVPVRATIEHIIDHYADVIKFKQISIRVDVNHQDHLFTDKEGVQIILRNLISNAIKFTEQASISISGYHEGQFVYCIEVKDGGKGMTAEELSLIQNENGFWHGQGTKGEMGSGLGLNLVRKMLQALDGSIRFASEPGKGTTAMVRINQNQKV